MNFCCLFICLRLQLTQGDIMKTTNFRLPKTKVGDITFKKIIRTGKRLFAKHGFQATSINDIIEKSKVAAGTFYLYFDNKLALYMYLLEEYKKEIRETSAMAAVGYLTRYEIERAGLKSFIKYAKRDPLAYKLIWESMSVDPAIFKQYYQSFSKSYVYHLMEFVDLGQVRSDVDLETASYVLMGIANFVGLQVVFKEDITEEQIDWIVDECMKIVKSGLLT
jgi:AcrR family transcriptional regulator